MSIHNCETAETQISKLALQAAVNALSRSRKQDQWGRFVQQREDAMVLAAAEGVVPK